MSNKKSSNPYDHLLIRTEDPVEVHIRDFKTITVCEDTAHRIRLFVANPQPFRFYVGFDIEIPTLELKTYVPVTETAKVGHSTTEQNAVLYALGRIVANYGEKLPAPVIHEVKQAIFNNRQRSLF